MMHTLMRPRFARRLGIVLRQTRPWMQSRRFQGRQSPSPRTDARRATRWPPTATSTTLIAWCISETRCCTSSGRRPKGFPQGQLRVERIGQLRVDRHGV